MKLVVFGSTGGAGRALVTQALEAGHAVTAVARRPAEVRAQHDRLRVVQGDVSQPEAVAEAIRGHEGVVLSVGPRRGTPAGTLISDATRAALAGMQRHRVRRLVLVSGLMVGAGRGLGPVGRGALALFRRLNAELYRDKVLAERLVLESNEVDWTIVRPPVFGERPARGSYRIGVDLDVKLLGTMANADVAAALLAVVTDAATVGRVLELSA